MYKGNLEWSGNQYIAASVKPVANVPGVISTASDYVYDEAEHGPILAQLLQGKKHDGRRKKEEELVVELENESNEEEEFSIEIENDASSDESNNDTAVLEKEEMELEQELRKELGEENEKHDEVKNKEHDEVKKQGGSYGMRQLSSEDIEGAIDDGELSMDGEQFQKLVSKERYDFDD